MPDRAHKTSEKARNLEQSGKKFIFHNVEELSTFVKEKKNTWAKSCKESSKRETEMFTLSESMVDDTKVDKR